MPAWPPCGPCRNRTVKRLSFDIEIREEPGLLVRAMTMARQLGRPSTYDCHYAALAEHHHCELWTGDQRFYHAGKDSIPWVRWIGDYEAIADPAPGGPNS
jgi:predicted nucleic acid-binding protein